MNVQDSQIKELLRKYKHLCVLGLSPDVSKPSHEVPFYMLSKGYGVTGIYPGRDSIDGVKIHPSLADVPREERKFLVVFRRSEKIPEVVDEVLAAGGVEVLWLQLGISHPDAEKRAEAAGLKTVSNRCVLVEHRKHLS